MAVSQRRPYFYYLFGQYIKRASVHLVFKRVCKFVMHLLDYNTKYGNNKHVCSSLETTLYDLLAVLSIATTVIE